jgi:PmbA protein
MSVDKNDYAQAERALALLKKLGVKDTALVMHSEESTTCDVREGKVEALQQSASASLNVGIYIDGRYAAHSTNDLRPAELEAFLKRAVALTKQLQEDSFRTLPDPKLYANRPGNELQLADAAYHTRQMSERKASAFAMEAAARAAGKNVVVASAGTTDEILDTLRLTSNGFRDRQTTTSFHSYANVTMADGDKRPEDSAYASARVAGVLPAPDALGREAAARAQARIGAKKIKSGAYPVLVEARAAQTLFRHLLSALNGRALQQKRSFLDGKLETQAFSKMLTITDDPLLAHGLGSRRFDQDGISAKKTAVVDQGTLKSFYIDWYYGKKLGIAPTTGGPSNLVVEPGTEAFTTLEKKIDKGIIVTSFIGGNSNSLTGDFSLGLVGFYVEKGERKHPVSELNLSGNHTQFWKQLAALGNDPWMSSSIRTPSLLFEGAAVSGA